VRQLVKFVVPWPQAAHFFFVVVLWSLLRNCLSLVSLQTIRTTDFPVLSVLFDDQPAFLAAMALPLLENLQNDPSNNRPPGCWPGGSGFLLGDTVFLKEFHVIRVDRHHIYRIIIVHGRFQPQHPAFVARYQKHILRTVESLVRLRQDKSVFDQSLGLPNQSPVSQSFQARAFRIHHLNHLHNFSCSHDNRGNAQLWYKKSPSFARILPKKRPTKKSGLNDFGRL
jgi:hypothetical protein